MWVVLTVLMVLLKRRSTALQKRELAESIEDARIFASSRQLDPTQNIMMKPIDQVSSGQFCDNCTVQIMFYCLFPALSFCFVF